MVDSPEKYLMDRNRNEFHQYSLESNDILSLV